MIDGETIVTPWVEENAGLWGLVALPLAVLLAVPSLIRFVHYLRDRQKSTASLHESLRETMGRRPGSGLIRATIGTDVIFPLALEGRAGQASAAIEEIYRLVTAGLPVAVLGNGGSGKSQLLADVHAHSFRVARGPADPLVEVVGLASAATKNVIGKRALVSVAIRTVAARYRMSRRAMSQLVAETKVVLAFDGLDELPDESRAAALDQILKLGEDVPVILTSRPVESSRLQPALEAQIEFGRFQRLSISSIDWSSVEQELSRAGIALPERVPHLTRAFLAVPLNMQVLLFMWKAGRVRPNDIQPIVFRPHQIISRFVQGAERPGRDSPMRLAALLAVAEEKSTESSFRPFPLQLAGATMTTTILISLVLWIGYCMIHPLGAQILVPVALAITVASPYPATSFIGRALTGFTGRPNRRGRALLCAAFAVALSVVSTIPWIFVRPSSVSWAVSLAGIGVVNAAVIYLFVVASPMSLARSAVNHGNYMETHAWPTFTVFVALCVLTITAPTFMIALAPYLAYVGVTCVYLIVSAAHGWVVVGAAPWRWRALLEDLTRRGLVCRDGRRYKFTHDRIQRELLHSAALDARGPRLLWSVSSAEVPSKLLTGRVPDLLSPPNEHFESNLWILASHARWFGSSVALLAAYYQNFAVNPGRAEKLLRWHLRLLPNSALRPLWWASLDSLDDERGAAMAKRALSSAIANTRHLEVCLRIVERHEEFEQLGARYLALLDRDDLNDAQRDFVRSRLIVLQLRVDPDARPPLRQVSGRVGEQELLARAVIFLERLPPDLDAASDSLARGCAGGVRYARIAQLLRLRADDGTSYAQLALESLPISSARDDVLEVALTAHAFGDHRVEAWLRYAERRGLSLGQRGGLQRNLQMSSTPQLTPLFLAIPPGAE